MGIPVHRLRTDQLIATVVQWGKQDRLRRVYNVNAHGMNLAAEHEDFRRCLQDADLVFCDGYGVKLGAEVLGMNIPDRMTPPDWIDDFATAVTAAGQSVFALGDEEGVAASFQKLLAERHGGYRDAGSFHGFFDKSGPDNDAVIDRINASGAVHLLVGFGMPLQERWIEANRHRLAVKVAFSMGALFRWYAGYEKRPAKWLTDHGLEWMGRLARHPFKHFRRYVVGNALFVTRVFRAWAGLSPALSCSRDERTAESESKVERNLPLRCTT